MSRSVHYHVRHETSYEYSGDVVHGHQLLHLTPRELDYQTCTSHEIHIDPVPTLRADDVDSFGNPVTRLEFDRPHRRLDVVAQMRLHSRERATPVACDESWERARSRLFYAARPPGTALLEASRFRFESPYVRIKQRFNDYAEECFEPGRPLLDCAEALTQKLFTEMTYAPGATTINTPLLDVLSDMRGVCQDYAHIMIACLRARGFAARYVSGYLRTTPAPGAPVLMGADASHAWVAVFCPSAGWVEFDPTNGVRANTNHITLAWGRDFGDVSPLRGVIVGGGQHTLSVRVTVTSQTTERTEAQTQRQSQSQDGLFQSEQSKGDPCPDDPSLGDQFLSDG
jgi:transglutaminase-like putative cysteine protease